MPETAKKPEKKDPFFTAAMAYIRAEENQAAGLAICIVVAALGLGLLLFGAFKILQALFFK